MLQRRLTILIILIMILRFAPMPVHRAKSYYAESFDVQIDIQRNGTILVTETVEFQFSDDPVTSAFRKISTANTDGIMFLEARMDGIPMARGTRAGQVEVKDGNPLRIIWHFSPASNTSHVFFVRYRADGVIRKGEGDTLVWHLIPEDHDYSIVNSTITLGYPAKATLLEHPTLNLTFDADWEDSQLIFTTGGLAENEDLILTARFAPGSLTRVAPRWQIQNGQANAAASKTLPVGFIAGMTTLIIGGLGLFTYIRANRQELHIPPVAFTVNPPSDLPLAIVGQLTGQEHTYIGAIFDLAQRGILEVREEKRFWGMQTHILVRKEHSVPLQPYEKGLMDALFEPGESNIQMNEIETRLAIKNELFTKPLDRELVQRGWLDPGRRQKRSSLVAGGVLTLILSMFALVFSLVSARISLSQRPHLFPWLVLLVGISVSLFILSIAFLVYAVTYSVLTPAGEETSAHWRGFAEYLHQISKGRAQATYPDIFARYFAYAAIFGLSTQWATYFQKLNDMRLPIWLYSLAGNHESLVTVLAVMSISDSPDEDTSASGEVLAT